MTIALESVLAKAGLRIDPRQFEALLIESAKKLAPPNPDSTVYFTRDQREILTDVGLDLRPWEDRDIDPRAHAIAAQSVLRDAAMNVGQAAERIGVASSRIRHRISDGLLAGWKEGGSWRLPAWQFTAKGVLPGLEVLLPAVPSDQPQLAVASFMATRQDDLLIGDTPSTPRDWLLAGGDPRRVADLASMLGTAI
jgi:hypothetical protein